MSQVTDMASTGGTASDDAAAVAAAHNQWFASLLAEDVPSLDTLLAPDVTLRFPGGNEMPRSRFLDLLQTGQLCYDSAEHEESHMRLYGRTGIVTGGSTLTYRFRDHTGSERLAYTAVYIQTGARWMLVAWQSTIAQQ